MSTAPQKPGLATPSAVAALAIGVVMTVAALSLWTVIPLGWLWIGSRISPTQFPTLGPYMVVFFGATGSILAISWLIGRLNRLYVRITGSTAVASMRPNWLRSMRDSPTSGRKTTLLETVIATSVILAVFAFVLWFFVAAGSPLPNQ
jgi:hypothetical protein